MRLVFMVFAQALDEEEAHEPASRLMIVSREGVASFVVSPSLPLIGVKCCEYGIGCAAYCWAVLQRILLLGRLAILRSPCHNTGTTRLVVPA